MAGCTRSITYLYDERMVVGGNLMMLVTVIAGLFFICWTMKSCAADMVRLLQ